MENILLVGTSHIAEQSLREIEEAFVAFTPAIVALELDRGRFEALFEAKRKRSVSLRDVRQIGFKGFLFVLIGSWIQKKLGKMVGTEPGSEMKTAALLAQKNNAQIALIDQPIEVTLRRFSAALSWKEKGRLVYDLAMGFLFPKREMKRQGMLEMDLHTVPSKQQVQKMILAFRRRYPTMYKVLVSERNTYMVRRVKALREQFPDKRVLVIVGAGHQEGMERLLGIT